MKRLQYMSRRTAMLLILLLSGLYSEASNYYWVGNSGAWSEANLHWANSSGGNTFYNFPPDSSDDVFFDANSFSSGGQRVLVDMHRVNCRNFDWSGVTNHPAFALDTLMPPNCDFEVNGSFILSPDMDWRYGSFNNFCTLYIGSVSSGRVLDFAGQHGFGRTNIRIGDKPSQTGLYILLNDVYCSRFEVDNGSLHTNGKNIIASDEITLFNGSTDFSNSIISTGGHFTAQHFANVNPGNSIIRCDGFYAGNSIGPYNEVFSNHASLNNSNIRQLHVNNQLDGFNSTIDAAFIGTDTTQNTSIHASGFHFGKCVCRGNNVHVQSGNSSFVFSFDTLFLATPGATYSFSDSDTLVINNRLIVNSGPANLTTIRTTPGFNNPARMYCFADTVCLDYLILGDLPAMGPAAFFAGGNSIDLGGNPGWNFSACSQLSNVWPGDADYDLQCNNLDVLSIGLAYGNTGPLRSNPDTSWNPHPSPNWPGYFHTGVNFKHADTDGNGVIDFADTVAVFANYGRTHPARIRPSQDQTNQTSPRITLIPSTHLVRPGDHLTVAIQLGTTGLPVDSIYGIAFTVNLDPSLVYLDSITTDFTSSWIGTASADLIPFTKISPFGQFDFTLVRNDHTDILGGNGIIGLFDVVIVDNVSTVQSQLLRVSGARAIVSDGTPFQLNAGTDSVQIDPLLNVGNTISEDPILLYPNPIHGLLSIQASSLISHITLTNSIGAIIKDFPGSQNRMKLDVSGLTPDVYVITIYTGAGIFRRKAVLADR